MDSLGDFERNTNVALLGKTVIPLLTWKKRRQLEGTLLSSHTARRHQMPATALIVHGITYTTTDLPSFERIMNVSVLL